MYAFIQAVFLPNKHDEFYDEGWLIEPLSDIEINIKICLQSIKEIENLI